ncbi:MAG: DUF4097 family beta strand repeat protein [Clostridia bacterium]|nr:DUF4097 family beta strand repeat protein [Clostridia bacterium]
MKPTSVIYLVLAVILFFGGFGMCKYAEKLAEDRNQPIYDQEIGEAGSSLYTYEIDNTAVATLKLVFSDVDVTIKPSPDEKSRVELRNFSVRDYSVTLNGSAVTVDGTVGKLASLLDRSSGGIQFRGLRYFLLKDPDPSLKRSVTVYISDASKLNSLSVSETGGSLSLSDIANPLDYSLSLKDCAARVSGVSTVSVGEISLKAGDLEVSGSSFNTLVIDSTDASVRVTSNGAIQRTTTSYDLSVTEGSLVYNGSLVEDGSYKISQAISLSMIRISVSGGNINLTDDEPATP